MATTSANRRWELWVVVAVAVGYATPLLLSRYFPGLDLPWHAAIVEVMHRHDAAAVQRDFLGYFAVDTRFTSYLTLYLTVDALAFVVGDVAVAMQLVIAAYVVTFVLSSRSLIRAFGGNGMLAVLAAPAAYSTVMEFGFLSYALAYPMTFWLWTLCRESFTTDRVAARLVAAVLLSGLIAVTHPFAAVVAIAGAFVIVLGQLDRQTARRAAAVAGCLVVGVVPAVLAVTMIDSGSGSDLPPAFLEWSGLWGKIQSQEFVGPAESFATAPVRLFGFIADGWCFAIALGGLISGVVARHVGGRPPREPGARGRVLVWLLLALIAMYLITPYTFHWPQRWFAAQPRLLPLVWVVGIALMRCRPTLFRRRAAMAGPVAVAAIALLVLVVTSLLPFAREAADFRAVIEKGAPRARTIGLIEQRPTVPREPASPWRHASAYILVENGGYSSNLPMSVHAGGNAGVLVPVKLAGDAPTMPASPPNGHARTFNWDRSAVGWDQFLIRDADPAAPHDYFGIHIDQVELVARAGRWRLYRRRGPERPAAR